MKDVGVLTYAVVGSRAVEIMKMKKGRGVREHDLDVHPLYVVLYSDIASSCITCHNTRPASLFLIVTARHHLLSNTPRSRNTSLRFSVFLPGPRSVSMSIPKSRPCDCLHVIHENGYTVKTIS
jgi:hypothetical protein